ncbi:MAG: hypothetical protein DRP95_06965, partial [Candidatus Latescibacterota bacterium]
ETWAKVRVYQGLLWWDLEDTDSVTKVGYGLGTGLIIGQREGQKLEASLLYRGTKDVSIEYFFLGLGVIFK